MTTKTEKFIEEHQVPTYSIEHGTNYFAMSVDDVRELLKLVQEECAQIAERY